MSKMMGWIANRTSGSDWGMFEGLKAGIVTDFNG
jgi:hypothetical protein